MEIKALSPTRWLTQVKPMRVMIPTAVDGIVRSFVLNVREPSALRVNVR